MKAWRYFLAWGCFFALINPGDLGSVDTARRLQVAHSWWTSAPEVLPADWPSFGILACGHVVRAWYGAGQSVLMLPADIVASYVTSNAQLRGVLVALLVFPALAVATLAVIETLLRELGLAPASARLGAAVFTVSTSFLPYVQINQENSLIGLVLVAGCLLALRHATTGSPLAVLGTGALAGLDILTRLPAAADAGLILALAVGLRAWVLVRRSQFDWRKIRASVVVGSLPLAIAVVIERVYQHARFCEWTGTYIGALAQRAAFGGRPRSSAFPFSTPFWTGVAGFLWSRDYSIFVTDPVLLFALGFAVVTWRRWRAPERAIFVTACVLLCVLVVFYARYYDWWGGASWGSRYTTAPAELLCLVSMAIVIREWPRWTRIGRAAASLVVAAGAFVNVMAIVFWYQLELQQRLAGVSAAPIVLLRAENIWALLTNGWARLGLLTPAVSHRLMTPNALAWLAKPRLGRLWTPAIAAWAAAMLVSLVGIVDGLRPGRKLKT